MRIGVIGSGMIGRTAAKLFVDAGHEVAIANSRGPQSLQDLVAELGGRARAATTEEAAGFGEVVLVAVPFGRYRELPGDSFAGRIVVDANNYYAQRDGRFPELDTGQTTSSELLGRHLRGARVIKAFNTMNFATLAAGGRPDAPSGQRLALFLAGDDPDAKRRVAELVEQIGFAPVDTGSLAEGGRRQQPGAPVYNAPMTEAQARAALSRG